jgi:hypothetical protein
MRLLKIHLMNSSLPRIHFCMMNNITVSVVLYHKTQQSTGSYRSLEEHVDRYGVRYSTRIIIGNARMALPGEFF